MLLPLSHLNSIHRCCLHDSDSMKGPKGQQRNLGMEKKPLGPLRARTFLRPAETLCLILPWHQPPTHIFSSGIHSVPVPVHVPVPVPVPHPLTHTHTLFQSQNWDCSFVFHRKGRMVRWERLWIAEPDSAFKSPLCHLRGATYWEMNFWCLNFLIHKMKIIIFPPLLGCCEYSIADTCKMVGMPGAS